MRMPLMSYTASLITFASTTYVTFLSGGTTSSISMPVSRCDPDNGLDYLNEEKLARVRFQITKLSLRQQQILDLYYGQNLQAQEIAARLHLSRRTIENIIYRALLTLRKSL